MCSTKTAYERQVATFKKRDLNYWGSILLLFTTLKVFINKICISFLYYQHISRRYGTVEKVSNVEMENIVRKFKLNTKPKKYLSVNSPNYFETYFSGKKSYIKSSWRLSNSKQAVTSYGASVCD